jgi:hypothetical protein
LDRFKKNKDKEKELIYQNKEKYIKDNLVEIKKMDLELKYIQMEIYILDNFKIIKNMEMESSFGLVFLQKIQNKTNMSSIIKALGGEVYQMVKEYIKKLMVIFYYYTR